MKNIVKQHTPTTPKGNRTANQISQHSLESSMKKCIFLFASLVLLLTASTSLAQSKRRSKQKRTVCGIDVSYQYSCWKQLRKLRQACSQNMTICGHNYSKGRLPYYKSAKRLCRRARRRGLRRWRNGLCNLPLYSSIRSYCGKKAISVAAACIRQKRKQSGEPQVAAVPPVAPKSQPQAPSAAPTPQNDGGVAPKETPKKQAPVSKEPTKQPAVGGLTQKAPASTGSNWLYFLNILTLLLLFYGFFLQNKQRERSSAFIDREQEPEWFMPSAKSEWGFSLSPEAPAQDEKSHMSNIDILTANMSGQMLSPMDELQLEADALSQYYLRLAKQVARISSQKYLNPKQQQVVDHKNKIQQLFYTYSATNHAELTVAKDQAMATLDSLLQQLGQSNLDEAVEKQMSTGQIDLETFFQNKQEDQAQLYLDGQPLDTFDDVRSQFLKHLEQFCRFNLEAVSKNACKPDAIPALEQEQIFYGTFVQRFLLSEFPEALQRIYKVTGEEESQLMEQLIAFIEEQLFIAGINPYGSITRNELEGNFPKQLHYILHCEPKYSSDPEVENDDYPSYEDSVAVYTRDIVSDSVPSGQSNDAYVSASSTFAHTEAFQAISSSPGDSAINDPGSNPPESARTTESAYPIANNMPLLQVNDHQQDGYRDLRNKSATTSEYTPYSPSNIPPSASPEK